MSTLERPELETLLKRAVEAYDRMTPEQKATMHEAQRQSWVRGMTARCEHGVLDFEQCPDCRGWR
jgi:hypothetical protein